MYLIRRKIDGLLSRGGNNPRFTKKGKVWRGSGPLRLHLQSVQRDYFGCEVVEIAYVEQGIVSIDHFVKLNTESKEKRDMARVKRIDEYNLKREK